MGERLGGGQGAVRAWAGRGASRNTLPVLSMSRQGMQFMGARLMGAAHWGWSVLHGGSCFSGGRLQGQAVTQGRKRGLHLPAARTPFLPCSLCSHGQPLSPAPPCQSPMHPWHAVLPLRLPLPRSHPFYAGRESCRHLRELRDVLLSYAMFNFDLGYVQVGWGRLGRRQAVSCWGRVQGV